mgnify:FL=1
MLLTLLNKISKAIFSDRGWVFLLVAGILGGLFAYYHSKVTTLEETIYALRRQNASIVASNEEHKINLEKQNASISKLIEVTNSVYSKVSKVSDRNKQITEDLKNTVREIKDDELDNSCDPAFSYLSIKNNEVKKKWEKQ